MHKKISVLGSTGVVGKATLEAAHRLGFEVAALAAHSNIDLLEQQARIFSPKLIAVYDKSKALLLQKRLSIPVLAGVEGLEEAARFAGVDFVMLAMSGSLGVFPAVAAIEAGKQIGLANKEILVCAGEYICALAKRRGVQLIPVDGEHSAIFQCLKGEKVSSVERLILTASGGSLRLKSQEELERVSVEEALCHPHLKMGPKTMIDTSTLMNKGLEMIEARWLFGIEKVDVVVHPESRVQSCVEFVDGAILAQIANPDMSLAVQYALTYPERRERGGAPVDFFALRALTFFPPDLARFRCLRLAMEAMKMGGSYPCYLNAANEVLVGRFLQREIPWTAIGERLEKLISSHKAENLLTLDSILSLDEQARRDASLV